MSTKRYISVLLPLALPKEYTYEVPEALVEAVIFGIRVEVPLKNKLYSGLVVGVHDSLEVEYRPRKIISVIDELPLIDERQWRFWKWLAAYYVCSVGEVMGVAMPSGLKLSSETKVIINEDHKEDFQELNDNQFLIAEAISVRKELNIGEIKDILNKQTVYPEMRALLDRGTIIIKEELVGKYKPRKETFIRLTDYYTEDKDRLTEALDLTSNAAKQTKMILAFTQLSKATTWVSRSDLYELSSGNKSVLDALVKKEIFVTRVKEISRLNEEEIETVDLPPMSGLQQEVYTDICKFWEIHDAVLLHGVTGSGKTRVYMEIIQEQIEKGRQVLYLLPEIALTTQIVQRLIAVFGNLVQVYHSRMNNHERVELWKSARNGQSIIIGARSSLFLPFKDLGAIIIDEEHDPSYKQQDPAPRYNARDAAVFLAMSYQAKVLLGSATPSLESYYNAKKGKYGLVEMMQRFGDVALPEILVVDLKAERKAKTMEYFFSKSLRTEIDTALVNGKQALLFQNRRGYAPTLQCPTCSWTGDCPNCDVTLTKHKFFGELRCHYCGFRTKLPQKCPDCGDDGIFEVGYGTEKIEDVLGELFPIAKVARLDYDTTRSKNSYEKIIDDFQNKKVDILVGTQMVTKGLDFDNIAVVGVLNADLLLYFPDFRASERAFQLLTQVAGRAGRRKEKGKVVIQTSQPNHPVITETIAYNYHKFIAREAFERKNFIYPPYFRMINILLKHKDARVVQEGAELLSNFLKHKMGKRVIGPAEPGIARIRNMYLRSINIKLEKNNEFIANTKKLIRAGKLFVKDHKGLKSIRINIDVDPY